MSKLLIHEMSLKERETLADQYSRWYEKRWKRDPKMNCKLGVEATIVDPDGFVQSHIDILISPEPPEVYQPFLDRLIKFKQLNS